MSEIIQALPNSGPKTDGKIAKAEHVATDSFSFAEVFLVDPGVAPVSTATARVMSEALPPDVKTAAVEVGESLGAGAEKASQPAESKLAGDNVAQRASTIEAENTLPVAEKRDAPFRKTATEESSSPVVKTEPAEPPKRPSSTNASLTQAAFEKSLNASGLAKDATQIMGQKPEALPAKMSWNAQRVQYQATPVVATPAAAAQSVLLRGVESKTTDASVRPNVRDAAQLPTRIQPPAASTNRAIPQQTTGDVVVQTDQKNGVFSLLGGEDTETSMQPPVRGHTGAETSHAARSATPSTPHAQVEVARQIGGQLAVAVTQNKIGVTEVALSPQELGRVNMILSAQDNTLSLLIMAERPETQDLMRRHIDQLNQEFRNLGFQDIKFSFGDGATTRDQRTASGSEIADPIPNDADVSDDTQRPLRLAADATLDVRL